MKLRKGQAHRIIFEAVLQLGRIVLWLCLLALALLGLFAFSLSRHPLEVPHLASWLATNISGDGITVRMDKAELAWSGYHQGGGVPLELRVSGIEVRNAPGTLLVRVPQADLTLPPVDLFGGRDVLRLRAREARLSGTEAPVSIHANIWPGPGYTMARGEFFVTVGPGVLGTQVAHVPISGASFTLRTAPGAVDVSDGQVALAPLGQSAPAGRFSFSARRGDNWVGSLHATLDAVHAAQLAQYWPAPLLHLTRSWVVKHITAGTARDAAFTFGLTAPGDLSSLKLASVTGGFAGNGLTLYWLDGGMPITGLDGQFTMPDIDNIMITASAGQVGQVIMRQGSMAISGTAHKDQTGLLRVKLSGTLPDVLTVLDAPPLSLLRHAPPVLAGATGQAEGDLTATIPFKQKLHFDEVRLAVTAKLHDVALPSLLPPLGARQGEVELQTDGHELHLAATAEFAGEPASLTLAESFAGAGNETLTLNGAAGPRIWHWLGVDTATELNAPAGGTAPFVVHITGTVTGAQTALLQADLTPAALGLPVFGWRKPAGVKGSFALAADLYNGVFVAARNFAMQAPGMNVTGVQQGGGLVVSTLAIGRSRASGTLTPPRAAGGAWVAQFSGPVLDIRRPKSNAAPASGPAAPPAAPSGPAWTAQLHFTQLYLAAAPAPAAQNFSLDAAGRGSAVLSAQGQAAGLDFSIVPKPAGRSALTLHSTDAGFLLRVLGDYDHMEAGKLMLTAEFGAGQPATGTATLLEARFVNAPDVTKFLQALTLYGLADAASGPGLKISRAAIPFALQYGVLTLKGARAYSSSLGFTASGTLDLANNNCDLDTTIVPLYALNALPGKIPLLGRLFSAEKGGGLLAMRARITGPVGHAEVRINPLSALTPGFLRGIFGLGEAPAKPAP